MARTLINLPKTARRGQLIEVRTTIAHPMETGLRADDMGRPMPRNILTHFECRYGNQVVFSATFFTATAANPYLAFFVRAEASGALALTWLGDNGFAQTETVQLTVT